MLKQRLLTALVLIPLVLAGIFGLPNAGVQAVLLLLTLLAAFEWAALSGLRLFEARLLYAAAMTVLGWLALEHLGRIPRDGLLLLFAAGWGVVAVWLGWLRVESPSERRRLLLGLPVLLGGLLALTRLHALRDGPWWLLYFLVLIWLADIAAYFTGRRFGRRKLAPGLSPGKTLEGVWGALCVASVYSSFTASLLGWEASRVLLLLLLSVLAVQISIVGDLFESLMKRTAGVKDSGRLFPGHGGVLDRIDSLLAAGPVFVAVALLTGLLV